MRIRRIKMTNYKGFDQKTVTLTDPHLSVVIGNNTSGKTTLLKAVQVGLGAYLQSLQGLPSTSEYRRNFTSRLDVYTHFDEERRDYIRNPQPTSIQLEADFYVEAKEVPVMWRRELRGTHTSFNRSDAGLLMSCVEQLESSYSQLKDALPICLSFGARRTSDSQTILSKKVNERINRFERAYRNCLYDTKIDFQGVIQWLKRYDKDLRDRKNFDGNREAFYKALQTAIPALSEIMLDQDEIEAVVSITGRSPERNHYSYMSDGLQSMIGMVSEIAYRCIMLNGFKGKEAVTATSGVVTIDEIDLYLHPHWQRHVLQDLINAFPHIQFIVSTHSPFIVQSLDTNQLISFDADVREDGEPFREGLEDITEQRMGLPQEIRSMKFNEMVRKAEELFEAADNHADNKSSLQQQLEELEAEYSDDPAYTALVRTEVKIRSQQH